MMLTQHQIEEMVACNVSCLAPVKELAQRVLQLEKERQHLLLVENTAQTIMFNVDNNKLSDANFRKMVASCKELIDEGK